MRIYIMTDLESVAGVRDFEDWCIPGGREYDRAMKLLTLEVNAAIEGFASAGATEFMVADGHGRGAINIELLDPRAEMRRGWPLGWPLGLDDGHYDALAFIGQHAKAGTEFAHLAHTQGLNYIDLSVNGVSIGEFGQLAMCASELGIRTIFGAGDLAFSVEAQALISGIETVVVKRGLRPGSGDEMLADDYGKRNTAAVHLQPKQARKLIRKGARNALKRMKKEAFGLIPLQAPFHRAGKFRPAEKGGPVLVSSETHPTSVVGMMNLPFNRVPEGSM
ncbi:MAG: M55 family metallopeptidase [Candidatus Poribacteria bacterium]|nr:M55 family metallopeptidase [Candidatus Poribacteria bacterium]